MNWTTARPTAPSWYWRRDKWARTEWQSQPEVVLVREYGRKLCVQNWEPQWGRYEWAGPIPEPEEG